MANHPTITHILYDMDGLLLNTEILYTQATEAVLSPHGKTFPWTLKAQMMGRPSIVSATLLVKTLALPITPEEYLSQRTVHLERLCKQAKAMPGAQRVTEHFAAKGIPQAIATSSHEAFYAIKTTQHTDWFSCFDAVIKGDDPRLQCGKPAPDIYLLAAEILGASPEQCLVFEDAPAGLEAGKAAGMSVVLIPDSRLDRTQVRHADLIIDSFEDFDPAPWGLPTFE